MKNKFFNKVILSVLIIGLIFIFNPNNVFASQEMKDLDYSIVVTDDGDIQIKETWNIELSDTNTLFKTFVKDNSYQDITDVNVVEIKEDGSRIAFTKENNYEYHVKENFFQALENPDNKFEIAWGVNQNDYNTRKFEISYTVKGHVIKYNDCAEIYWKLIGDDFEIPIEKISGDIIIPKGIISIEDLRVWAHGPLNGTINKVSTERVTFEVDNLPSKNYLEIRIATPNVIFSNANRVSGENRLKNIINEETKWADEANQRREQDRKKQELIYIIITILGITITIVLIYKAIKNYNKLKRTSKLEPLQKLDYFREMPDEEASALEAGFLYYFSKGGILPQVSQIISASMLNMALKEWISFEQELEDKKKVNIILNTTGKKDLTEDEKVIYDFLIKIPKNDNKFTMKEFQKYCNNNTKKCQELINSLPDMAEKIAIQKKLYDKEVRKEYNRIITAAGGYVGFAIMMIFIANINLIIVLAVMILSIINSIILTRIASRVNGLTQKGIDEKEKWIGLKKYMEDFSMLNEKEIPDLVLWEKYLVFATVFGISDKVIKQLKIKYPELNDEDYIRNHYTYMYLMCNNNFNFINSMNSSVGNVTNYSSGTGDGGGFSSGGGFGGGGGGGGGR